MCIRDSNKAIQYGPSVKSFAVYMSQYQLIPYARVQEVLKDQFGLKISSGSLSNFNKEAFEKLEFFERDIISNLSKEKLLHADETGIKVDTELAWIHVLATNNFTFYYPHINEVEMRWLKWKFYQTTEGF